MWGDDPTVIELEREVAAMLGKEAALYVPSGTMGNQIAIRCQTRPGDEILVHELAHVIVHEAGRRRGAVGRADAHDRRRARPARPGAAGAVAARPGRRAPRPPAAWSASRTRIGELGGLVYPQDRIDAIAAFAHERGMRLHMDGARLWNAAVASGSDPGRIVRDVDSVSVCFSKGLGAPVGSAVVGDADLIATARRNRKLLGGGMRQAGIIAAGALHALRHHVERLADDHRNARALAEGLAGCPSPAGRSRARRDEHRVRRRPGRRDRRRRWSPSWRRPACCAPISAPAPCVS